MSQVHTFAFFTGERSVSCIGVFGFGMHGLFAQHEQRCRKLSCTLCCWHWHAWATVSMHDKSAGTGGTIAGMCSVTLQM